MPYNLETLARRAKEATPGKWSLDWDWFKTGLDIFVARATLPAVAGMNLSEVQKQCERDRLFVEEFRDAANEMIIDLQSLVMPPRIQNESLSTYWARRWENSNKERIELEIEKKEQAQEIETLKEIVNDLLFTIIYYLQTEQTSLGTLEENVSQIMAKMPVDPEIPNDIPF